MEGIAEYLVLKYDHYYCGENYFFELLIVGG